MIRTWRHDVSTFWRTLYCILAVGTKDKISIINKKRNLTNRIYVKYNMSRSVLKFFTNWIPLQRRWNACYKGSDKMVGNFIVT